MVEIIIVLGLVALGASIVYKHYPTPVDMNHKAPNVHNVQMKGRVGPPTAADKPAPVAAPAKKATKKTTKKKKKTVKKTSSKK